MGIHSPFGYVGYEKKFLKTFINLLDDFCSRCHTDRDFHKGCRGCPVGNLIYEAKEYLLNAYESDTFLKEAKIFRIIKEEIKNIEPHTIFKGFATLNIKDRLLKLRKLLKKLEEE